MERPGIGRAAGVAVHGDLHGDLGAANLFVWFASHLLFDMKFMAIFSMLFGAGVVLMADRRAAAGKPSAGVHYRRMLWLLLFGAAHGWLLWYGDILVTYALCGMADNLNEILSGVNRAAEEAGRQPEQREQYDVAVARAVARFPKIILFDEPTSALDPEMIGEVLDVI